jgi:hypothetical protein
MKIIEIAVPEGIITSLGLEDAARKEAQEAFVLDLVRRGPISNGKAAELGSGLLSLCRLVGDTGSLPK